MRRTALSLLPMLLLGFAAGARPRPKPKPRTKPKPAYIPMKVLGVRSFGDNYAVVLHREGSQRVLPIFIGEREAQAIQMRLSKVSPPRPLTHDLLESVLAILGAKVERVEVDDLRKRVFIGKLNLRDARGRRYRLDGRPSDLIALAVGAGLVIHVAPHVLKEAGVDLNQRDKQGPRRPPDPEPKPPPKRPGPDRRTQPTSL
jgi:bifunctional DNase/RNase